MPASEEATPRKNLCGKWMPRVHAYCARGAGHGGFCKSPKAMKRQATYMRAQDRPYDPVAAHRWRSTHRLTRYGLTPGTFDKLLIGQGYACGMCLEPFEDGQIICIDHDHQCCPEEKKSCGRCVRGLLCLGCNRALGIIEARYDQARQYLDQTPARIHLDPLQDHERPPA